MERAARLQLICTPRERDHVENIDHYFKVLQFGKICCNSYKIEHITRARFISKLLTVLPVKSEVMSVQIPRAAQA